MLACLVLFIYNRNGHEEVARRCGFRMSVELRKHEVRSNSYIDHAMVGIMEVAR